VRPLSPEEADLWSRVAATIKPLSRDKIEIRDAEQPQVTVPKAKAVAATRSNPVAPARKQLGSTLDGGWDRRLRSGNAPPDVTLDLHGMSLDRAWTAIDRTLERAIARGARVVLLITGHHRPGDPPVERGKIRAAVHDWLHVSRHAPAIAAVRGAHRRHGGGGSLYIVLRRR
jgi:DNA-nicking Smr family endonuclease